MFIGKYVAKLVADTWRRSNDFIYISMRMTIDPVIYSAILNKVFMFYREGTIQLTTLKLWSA